MRNIHLLFFVFISFYHYNHDHDFASLLTLILFSIYISLSFISIKNLHFILISIIDLINSHHHRYNHQ